METYPTVVKMVEMKIAGSNLVETYKFQSNLIETKNVSVAPVEAYLILIIQY